MNGIFNEQILVEKLAKLNSSQKSIETLSHWCIFHRKRAKQVVETWERQFHCSLREQRLSFLYLANDILQNSRRNGLEFVGEFWKVLPNALRDVVESGDDFGKNAVLRLINIWDERKVFGSRGQILKEELMGKTVENNDKNNNNNSYSKNLSFRHKHPFQAAVEKIISSYENVYGSPVDEETLLSKCRSAIGCIEKAEKEIGGDYSSGQFNGSKYVEELQGQHDILTECIEQLRTAESSRASLVSHLKEALQEQEFKLDQVHNQLQVAESQSAHISSIRQQLLNCNRGHMTAEQRDVNAHAEAPSTFTPETPATGGDKEQSAPVMYTREESFTGKSSSRFEEDPRKSAAAAVAAKLAASTSSAQMLSYVFSSLASESADGNPKEESPDALPFEKRPKLENLPFSYFPPQHSQQPPLPPFPHPDSLQNKATATSQMPPQQPPHQLSPQVSHPDLAMHQAAPPPLPTLPQLATPPFMQTAGSMIGAPYNYTPPLPPPPGFSIPRTPLTAVPYPSPPIPYQNFQGPEGFFSQPPIPATPPISRS
ncbi:hypothetical protein AAG906_014209 [Vitis piasezkii]